MELRKGARDLVEDLLRLRSTHIRAGTQDHYVRWNFNIRNESYCDKSLIDRVKEPQCISLWPGVDPILHGRIVVPQLMHSRMRAVKLQLAAIGMGLLVHII